MRMSLFRLRDAPDHVVRSRLYAVELARRLGLNQAGLEARHAIVFAVNPPQPGRRLRTGQPRRAALRRKSAVASKSSA
jgi:hypothetical protein